MLVLRNFCPISRSQRTGTWCEQRAETADRCIPYMYLRMYDFARFAVENPVRSATLERQLYFDGVHLTERGYYMIYNTVR